MNEYINISQIENWLHGRLREVLGVQVYVGSLPSVLETGKVSMCMVNVVRATDTSEYGRVRGTAMAEVWIYARPSSNGRKNVREMNRLETALAEFAEVRGDDHYTIAELYSVSGYSKEIDYHFKTTMIQIQIH